MVQIFSAGVPLRSFLVKDIFESTHAAGQWLAKIHGSKYSVEIDGAQISLTHPCGFVDKFEARPAP